MSMFFVLMWMLLFFLFIDLMATLFAVEEHKTIIPEPWDISGEEE